MRSVRMRRAVVVGMVGHVIGRHLMMRRRLTVEVGLLWLVVLRVVLVMGRRLLVRWLLIRHAMRAGSGRRCSGGRGQRRGRGREERRSHLPSCAAVLLIQIVEAVRWHVLVRGVVVCVLHVFHPTVGIWVKVVQRVKRRGVILHHRQWRRGHPTIHVHGPAPAAFTRCNPSPRTNGRTGFLTKSALQANALRDFPLQRPNSLNRTPSPLR